MADNRYSRRRDARQAACATAFELPSFPVAILVVLGLLAVFIQSFVVQTHVHIPGMVEDTQSIGLPSLNSLTGGFQAPVLQPPANTPRDKYPADEDPSNCPLCQEFAHSGVFVIGAAALISLPFYITFHVVVLSEKAPSRYSVSHSWQGRAPPKA